MYRDDNYNHQLTTLLFKISLAEKEIREQLATLYLLSGGDENEEVPIGTIELVEDEDFIHSMDPNVTRTFDRIHDLRKLIIDILNTNELDVTPDDLFESI